MKTANELTIMDCIYVLDCKEFEITHEDIEIIKYAKPDDCLNPIQVTTENDFFDFELNSRTRKSANSMGFINEAEAISMQHELIDEQIKFLKSIKVIKQDSLTDKNKEE